LNKQKNWKILKIRNLYSSHYPLNTTALDYSSKFFQIKLLYSICLMKLILKEFNPLIKISCYKQKKNQITFLKSPNRHKKFQTHLGLNYYKIRISVILNNPQLQFKNLNIFKLTDFFNFNSIYLNYIKSHLSMQSDYFSFSRIKTKL
jgi:hypothetical protein